jgi:hypothetical protein
LIDNEQRVHTYDDDRIITAVDELQNKPDLACRRPHYSGRHMDPAVTAVFACRGTASIACKNDMHWFALREPVGVLHAGGCAIR